MDSWNDKPTGPARTYRFEVGEVAIFNMQIEFYYGTPCTVIERGVIFCDHCKDIHDYGITLCDGRNVCVDDCDLKKFKPPADEQEETEEREHEHTH